MQLGPVKLNCDVTIIEKYRKNGEYFYASIHPASPYTTAPVPYLGVGIQEFLDIFSECQEVESPEPSFL